MANKRVPELAPITAAELAPNDLFLLSDVSAIESKNLSVTQLQSYFQANTTGSLTASYALNARSASYLIYAGFPNGTASYALTSSFNISSSHALWADTASYALLANTASYSITTSYAVSCSYAATSSVQLVYSSAYSDYAKSASYLIYNGYDNGTAYHSITASQASLAISSYNLIYSGTPNGTASYSITASNSNTSSYLIYKGYNNGTASNAITASYALSASVAGYLTYISSISNGTASNAFTASYAITASNTLTSSYSITASYAKEVPGIYQLYGPFTPTLSDPNNGLVSVSITSSYLLPTMIFEFYGDIGIPFRNNAGTDGKVTINAASTALPSATVLVATSWAHSNTTATGSLTHSFVVRSPVNNSMLSNVKWDIRFTGSNCSFQNNYNPLTMYILSKQLSDVNVA